MARGTPLATATGTMRSILPDLRYALRNVKRSPGFFAAALLTLGIGIGTNATVFSFINALLFRPVAGVAEPSSLVSVYTSDYSSGPYAQSSYPDYLTLKQDAPAFAALAAYDQGSALVRVGNAVERVRHMAVTPEFFDVLGVEAAAGRPLTTSDFNRGAPGVVIADNFWRRVFDANPAVLGRTVAVDDVAHTVVGIAPARFTGLSINSVDIWIPLGDTIMSASQRGDRQINIVGRLEEGADLDTARTQLAAIAARLARDHPDSNRGTLQSPDRPRPITAEHLTRIHPAFRAQVMALSGVLMGAVLLVLLIACANVASLMLARAAARRREVAIRLALGAGRRRIAQQMLTESLLLAAAGCGAGVLFALWTSDVLPSFFPPEQARLLDVVVDIRVFGYSALISLVSAGLFSMAPAMQSSRIPVVSSLRASAGEATGRAGGRLRRSLIAAQIALATVLLVSAGLLVRSLVNAFSADLGFSTHDAVLASIELPHDPSGSQPLAYFRASLEGLRALPGVEAATVTTALPLGLMPRRGFSVEGYEPRQGEDREIHFLVVERDYFETLGIDLLAGRIFDARDDRRGTRVVMVNAMLADRYFGGRAVGKRMTDSSGVTLEVVGVVRTGKYLTVKESVPTVYYPLEQAPESRMSLIARTTGDPMQLAAAVRATMTAEGPAAAVYRVRTLESHISEALAGERLMASLVATCGGIALLLALVGVYGIVSYAVGIRTREIGLRVALGAAPITIVRLVLSEGIRVLVAGLLIGLAAAAIAARLLQNMLYGVGSLDVTTFGGVMLALAAATIMAASLPARRALAVDPIVALRDE